MRHLKAQKSKRPKKDVEEIGYLLWEIYIIQFYLLAIY